VLICEDPAVVYWMTLESSDWPASPLTNKNTTDIGKYLPQ